jgi:hypothetical protein
MNMNNRQQVITYVPEASPNTEEPAGGPGILRPGLDRKPPGPGLYATLVLLLAVALQVFMAGFIALNGLKNISFFANSSLTVDTQQALSRAAALILAVVLQGLLVVAIGRVARPRPSGRPVWWWLMLAALLPALALDFLLLFSSTTAKTDLAAAWQTALNDPLNGLIFLLLAGLNLLSLLGGALAWRPGSGAAAGKLDPIAGEILLEAGDSARAKAAQVWQKLGVNPRRFIPLHPTVLGLISKKYPGLFPPQIGGNSWAYDFTSHTFAAIPPEVHQALMQNRQRLSQESYDAADADDNQLLWRLPPNDLAEMIIFYLETYGKPRFIDITNPENPQLLTGPVALGAPGTNSASNRAAGGALDSALQPGAAHRSAGPPSPVQTFVASLTSAEKALFGSYLTHTVFPHIHQGSRFPQGVQDMSIFEVFDSVKLQWYYRYWKKQTGCLI